MLTWRSCKNFYISGDAMIRDNMNFYTVALFEKFAAVRQWAGVTIIGVGHDVLAAFIIKGDWDAVVAVTMPAGSGEICQWRSILTARQLTYKRVIRH
jgi:hypothetical protein